MQPLLWYVDVLNASVLVKRMLRTDTLPCTPYLVPLVNTKHAMSWSVSLPCSTSACVLVLVCMLFAFFACLAMVAAIFG